MLKRCGGKTDLKGKRVMVRLEFLKVLLSFGNKISTKTPFRVNSLSKLTSCTSPPNMVSSDNPSCGEQILIIS